MAAGFSRSFPGLPGGIPDESTFRRVFGCLNPLELQKGLEDWLTDVKMRTKGENETARLVNIDGKTIMGSGFHVVSAWIGEHGLTPGQLTTEEKSNEIKVVPKLLDIPGVKGDMVTADAMSCQKEIARKMALHRLRKLKIEKKRVSAKRRMMHAALDSDFLYEALCSE
jgi:hypothetical protein